MFQTLAFVRPEPAGAIGLAELCDLLAEHHTMRELLVRLRERARREDRILLQILRITRWNISLTSRLSGLSRTTIYKKTEQAGWRRERDC